MAYYKWTNTPEFIELLSSLIEKTKDAMSPINISDLTKDITGLASHTKKFKIIIRRIRSLRPIIHQLEGIDEETKVKLIFGLSGFVEEEFLEKLRDRAVVILDDEQRIIEYTTKGSGLRLSGTHWKGRGTDADSIERNEKMLELLAQIANNTNSPISDMEFARRFIQETGSPKSDHYLRSRFFYLKNEIHKSDDFDHKTKVRMCFISRAVIPEHFQEILRKDAHVEFDDNRIICYISKDGTMELGKKNCKKAEGRKQITRRSIKRASESATNSESASTSEAKKKMVVTSSEAEPPSTEKLDDSDPTPNVELKPFRGDLLPTGLVNGIEANEDIKVVPRLLLLAPKEEEEEEEQLLVPKVEAEEEDDDIQIIEAIPMKLENPPEPMEIKPKADHNSKLKLLDSMKSLISLIHKPSLRDVQSKIQHKIRKIQGSGVMIQNNEIIPTITLMINKVTNLSVKNLPSNEKSVRLLEFFCFLKAAIQQSELVGLESLLETIEEHNEKADVHLKKVPVDKVVMVLLSTIDVV